MRAAAITGLIFVTACGGEPLVATSAPASVSSAALEVGAAADAILGQLSERGDVATRTDAGGFSNVVGVAVSDTRLWIADAGNHRVLGYETPPTSTGVNADLVLGQGDFFTTDYRQIPEVQRLMPVGVAVDPEERVYVYSGTKVLVYNDPFADDLVADYELNGLPLNVRAVRALDDNKLAVAGMGGLVFFERGSADPYAQANIAVPASCVDGFVDIAQESSVYLAACSGQIHAYGVDAATGFVDPADLVEPVAVAYNDFSGVRSIHVFSNHLFVADMVGHRVYRFDDPSRQARAMLNETGTVETPTVPVTVPYYGQAAEATERGLSSPRHLSIGSDGRMWVADSGNFRVTVYQGVGEGNPSREASTVVGQADANHGVSNRLEANGFAGIRGVAVGPGAPSLPRAAVVDEAARRVLLYDDFTSYVTGNDPDHVLGQATFLDSESERTASRFEGPTHVAIEPVSGAVWVTDAANGRVMVFASPATGAAADRNQVFCAPNLTSACMYNSLPLGALAVSSTHAFVAAGNRVFIYQTDTPAQKPWRVIGQEQPLPGDPLVDDIGNAANRGVGVVSADSLDDVSGLALDAEGRLWVADRGNNRVLWFDDPTAADLTAAVTADGVVGQEDFSSGAPAILPNRYSFGNFDGNPPIPINLNGPSDVAISDDGTLWVSDATRHRVLVFFTPTEIDPVAGMPRADLVLGQEDFTSGNANMGGRPNARTLNAPFSVAISGRVLLISDKGNNRAVRTILNSPPVVAGSGDFDVVRGESLAVTVTITDADSDPISVEAVPPYVAAASGTASLSVPVTYAAPIDAPVGSRTVVNVTVTDDGVRPQTTTFSVVFRVVDRTPTTGGSRPAARPPLDPDTGCVCATGATGLAWLAPLLVWRFKRRRR